MTGKKNIALLVIAGIGATAFFSFAVRNYLRTVPEPPPALPPLSRQWLADPAPRWAQTESGRTAEPAASDKPDARPAAEPHGSAISQDAIADEHILAFADDSEQQEFLRLAESFDVQVLDYSERGHTVRVRARNKNDWRRLLEQSPAPRQIGRNYTVYTPGHLPPPSPPPGVSYRPFGNQALSWLGAPEDNREWGKGVTVAVLDMDLREHPALERNIVEHLRLDDMASGPGKAPGWHGTAVAALLAGNHDQWRGVAPAAKLLNIPVLDEQGTGDMYTLAQAIMDAVDHGADVVNLCLGSRSSSFVLEDAVAYARKHGVPLIAAAGNDGSDRVLYPARYEGTLAVAAVDAAQQRLYFSNRGEEVDLAAPGLGLEAPAEDEAGALFSGTSAAVPLVSGAAAWLLSEQPDLDSPELYELLARHAADTGRPGRNPEFGDGILDLRRLQERDKPGIHDIAVRPPYIVESADGGGTFTVLAIAQNQGTEKLPAVDLLIEIGDRREQVAFSNVAPGQTVQYPLEVPSAAEPLKEGMPLTVTASLRDLVDRHPDNNRMSTAIRLSEPKQER